MFLEDEDPEEDGDAGGEGEGESEDENGASEGDDDKSSAGQVTMSQVDLDKMISKRVDRSKRSAITNLLSGLGLDKTDDLKEALGKLKEFEDSEKSETEKLQGDLDTATAAVTTSNGLVEELQTKLKNQSLRSAVIAAAREADFLAESFDDVWLVVQSTTALNEGLVFDEETQVVTGAKAVVAKVAKDRPHWVEQSVSGKIPGRKSSFKKGKSRSGANNAAGEEDERPLVRL